MCSVHGPGSRQLQVARPASASSGASFHARTLPFAGPAPGPELTTGLVQETGRQATGGARRQAGSGWGGRGQAAGAGSSRRGQHVLRRGDVSGHGCARRREGPLQLRVLEKAWESAGQSAFLCDVDAATARASSRCGSSIARGCQREGLSVSVRERGGDWS